jgi:hypothetical protein
MPQVLQYWLLVVKRAWAETSQFVALHKFAVALAPATLTPVYLWLVFGVISVTPLWKIALSAAMGCASALLFTFFLKLLAVPSALDKEKTEKMNEATKRGTELREEIAHLKSPPEIDAKVMKHAQEGWNKLSPEEKRAVKLLVNFGDMTDANALQRLGLSQVQIFGQIETKANFVHRTEGTQPHEHAIGYRGTWKINPHFSEALQQIIKDQDP